MNFHKVYLERQNKRSWVLNKHCFLGPPSVAVRILLDHLKIPYEFIYVKYYEGETLGEEFGKVCGWIELLNSKLIFFFSWTPSVSFQSSMTTDFCCPSMLPFFSTLATSTSPIYTQRIHSTVQSSIIDFALILRFSTRRSLHTQSVRCSLTIHAPKQASSESTWPFKSSKNISSVLARNMWQETTSPSLTSRSPVQWQSWKQSSLIYQHILWCLHGTKLSREKTLTCGFWRRKRWMKWPDMKRIHQTCRRWIIQSTRRKNKLSGGGNTE